jgi:hypothetical protein
MNEQQYRIILIGAACYLLSKVTIIVAYYFFKG